MSFTALAIAIAGGMFLGTLASLEVGRRLGKRRLARDPEGVKEGKGAIEGAVFGLLGLLLAFTFTGAASRFDSRRELVAREANAIGTAYLRIDLLPPDAQPHLRDLFRRYLDSRITTFETLQDRFERVDLERSNALQQEIWKSAVAGCRASDTSGACLVVLPSMNEMFDITTTRLVAMQTHPPAIVFGMLGILMLASAVLAGYGMAVARRRSWIHLVAFTLVMAATIYIIVDIEFPRVGLIRMTSSDQVMRDLRRSMD